MPPTVSSEDLSTYLEPDLATDLIELLAARNLRVRTPARPWRPDTGYTGALLATLVVEGSCGSDQVLMKVCPPGAWESGPHLAAWTDHPTFARAHLVALRDDLGLGRTRDGGLIMFQQLAGDGGECRLLSELPGDRLVAACRHIVTAVLTEWNDDRLTAGDDRSTGDFIRDQLGPAALATSSLRHWAHLTGLIDHRRPWVRIEEEDEILPNPVTVAFGPSPVLDRPVSPLLGRGHGDLHLGNVLVPVDAAGAPDLTRFALIDLATYSSAMPLTADPAYLMLAAIAHELPRLPASRQADLLQEVVEGLAAADDQDPAFAVVGAIRAAAWSAISARGQGWAGGWSHQFLLSTFALALLFTNYQSLGSERRWWFFRLAARSAARLLGPDAYRDPRAPVLANPFADTVASPPAAAPGPPPMPAPRLRPSLSARAWRAARGNDIVGARHLLRQQRELVCNDEPVAAARAMSDLLADAVHILGADDELTLGLRYDLAMLTSRVPGRARAARALFQDAWAECARVLGRDHHHTRRCARARDATGLTRRAQVEG